MSDYEFYWTIFHGVLGLVSSYGIVYLLAKSEKIIKIYPQPHEYTVQIIEERFEVKRYQLEFYTPREDNYDLHRVQVTNIARARFADDVAKLAIVEEVDDMRNYDSKTLRLYLDIAVRVS